MKRALVIGYGSIGKRHAGILSKFKKFDEIFILTTQKQKKYKSISDVEEIKDINPSYIVIASTTNKHFKYLHYCEKNLSGKIILVEKPVFNKIQEFKINNNIVYVGYNLRFHPIIQKIKKEINNENLFNVNIQNSSYLPNWRLGRDYSKTSSAKKTSAGGILLDLSHELDFIQYLFGKYIIDYSFNKKISHLNIDTDDILIVNGHIKKKSNKKIRIQVNLNFFSSISKREIFIDGKKISIFGDINNSKLKIDNRKKFKSISYNKGYKELINKTYVDMHKAAIKKDEKIICTFDQGLNIMNLIENIKKEKKL